MNGVATKVRAASFPFDHSRPVGGSRCELAQ